MDHLLHKGDVVIHRQSGRVGKVTGFAHDGTIDVLVDSTGPYPQTDLQRLVPETSTDPLVEAIRASVPSLRTQAQYDAFMVAFTALRQAADGICSMDEDKASKGRTLLLDTLDTLKGVTATCEKLREVPEAAASPASEAFKRPPAQFNEQMVQARLLDELAALPSYASFQIWYQSVRGDIERVVSPTFRNTLFDAIRTRKIALQGPG